MRRTLLSCVALVALGLTGCTTCDAPFDYCGPMQTGNCGGECDFYHRENSAFSGMTDVMVTEGQGQPTLVEESAQLKPIPNPQHAPMIGRRPHTNQMR